MNRTDVIEQSWAYNQPVDFSTLPAELEVHMHTRIQFSREHPDLPVPKRVQFMLTPCGQVLGVLDAVAAVVFRPEPQEPPAPAPEIEPPAVDPFVLESVEIEIPDQTPVPDIEPVPKSVESLDKRRKK